MILIEASRETSLSFPMVNRYKMLCSLFLFIAPVICCLMSKSPVRPVCVSATANAAMLTALLPCSKPRTMYDVLLFSGFVNVLYWMPFVVKSVVIASFVSVSIGKIFIGASWWVWVHLNLFVWLEFNAFINLSEMLSEIVSNWIGVIRTFGPILVAVSVLGTDCELGLEFSLFVALFECLDP